MSAVKNVEILTLPAQDYVGPGKRIRDEYSLIGVHFSSQIDWLYTQTEIPREFLKRIPENAEVVVDLRVISSGRKEKVFVSWSGVALIPKDSKSKKL